MAKPGVMLRFVWTYPKESAHVAFVLLSRGTHDARLQYWAHLRGPVRTSSEPDAVPPRAEASTANAGYDFVPIVRLTNLLKHFEFSTIVDGGAHRGQWSANIVPELRLSDWPRVILVDPLYSPDESHIARLMSVADLEIVRAALSDTIGAIAFNVASNDGQSSSALAFAEAHVKAARDVSFTSETIVPTVTLDSLMTLCTGDRILLKLDLQGFEATALSAAKDMLAMTSVVVAEVSLQETYVGAGTLVQIQEILEERGFVLIGLVESFSYVSWGPMVQMDAIFAKSSELENIVIE